MEQAERRIPEITAVEPAESIGAYLARQRRLRGIDIEELSRATRIPVRSLQRLESGAFDGEPDGFARGFVRTVAGALGLPADETIARMLPEVSEAEAERGSRRFGWRAVLAASALAALTGLGGALWIAASHGGLRGPAAIRRDAIVKRHDAVRELAAARGLLGEPEPDRAAPDRPKADAPRVGSAPPASPR